MAKMIKLIVKSCEECVNREAYSKTILLQKETTINVCMLEKRVIDDTVYYMPSWCPLPDAEEE